MLCRYGIEYVSDPLTGKKIPTCHRAQYTLITQDPDYLEALSHADEMQKEVFQREAEYIANVQKAKNAAKQGNAGERPDAAARYMVKSSGANSLLFYFTGIFRQINSGVRGRAPKCS